MEFLKLFMLAAAGITVLAYIVNRLTSDKIYWLYRTLCDRMHESERAKDFLFATVVTVDIAVTALVIALVLYLV